MLMMRNQRQVKGPPDEADYVTAAQNAQALSTHLPADALGDLAHEVIRRLSDLHAPVSEEDRQTIWLEQFCLTLLQDDGRAALKIVRRAMERGQTSESVYVGILAEAARMLGRWWDEDRASFADVTLGTGRIYAILTALREDRVNTAAADRFAVFASVPGDTHTLGVRMAADLFRQKGWTIELRQGLDHDTLVEEITRLRPHVVGLSAAGLYALPALSRLVAALRICDPDIALFVGGHVTETCGEAVRLLAIDGMASDMHDARKVLSGLWDKGVPTA